jgi:cytochrome oxidase Cu insertion factor (SCO1/SenC/PrrC family)
MIRLSAITSLLILALAGCHSSSELASVSAGNDCPHCTSEEISDTTYATEWLDPSERGAPVSFPAFQDQNERSISVKDLRGAPLAVSFIYTRCENQRKCPLVAQTMAELEAKLVKTKITPRPRLALITYDPEYDTPEQLKAFGTTHGLQAMLLRPEPTGKEQLFKDLNVRVNFNERGVNLHGVQLILFDKQGRFVRAHHTLIWDNDKVLADLKQLAAE